MRYILYYSKNKITTYKNLYGVLLFSEFSLDFFFSLLIGWFVLLLFSIYLIWLNFLRIFVFCFFVLFILFIHIRLCDIEGIRIEKFSKLSRLFSGISRTDE